MNKLAQSQREAAEVAHLAAAEAAPAAPRGERFRVDAPAAPDPASRARRYAEMDVAELIEALLQGDL